MELSRQELDGGYRRLCSALLAQAAMHMPSPGYRAPGKSAGSVAYRGEQRLKRGAALAWIEGGAAVLPFSEVAEVLDIDEGRVRAGLRRLAGQATIPMAVRGYGVQ